MDYILFGTVCALEHIRQKNKIATLLPISENR